jgi:hypothetical protein
MDSSFSTVKHKRAPTHITRIVAKSGMHSSASFPRMYPPNPSSLFEAVLFAFVKEVGFGGPEVDNFGTALGVLAQLAALSTVVGIGDTRIAANDAPTGQAPVIALVANVHEDGGVDKGRTHDANPITYKRLKSSCITKSITQDDEKRARDRTRDRGDTTSE